MRVITASVVINLSRLFCPKRTGIPAGWKPALVKYNQRVFYPITGFQYFKFLPKNTIFTKNTVMATIVINIKDNTKAKHILSAVKLLNGVTRAEIATDEYLENISILKACNAARKTPKVSKSEILDALK